MSDTPQTEEVAAPSTSIHLRPLPKSFGISQAMAHLKQKDGTTKDYLPVMWRLVWFREQCIQGTIDTQEIEVDLDREISKEVPIWNKQKQSYEMVKKTARGYARYKAVVTDGRGGRATGTKSESAVDFPDFVEKAETGAIGRGLAGLGFGTQFAIELAEDHRITDNPVDPSPSRRTFDRRTHGTGDEVNDEKGAVQAEVPARQKKHSIESSRTDATDATDQSASEAQKSSLQSLHRTLKRLGADIEEPNYDGMSYQKAKDTINDWSARWRVLKATPVVSKGLSTI